MTWRRFRICCPDTRPIRTLPFHPPLPPSSLGIPFVFPTSPLVLSHRRALPCEPYSHSTSMEFLLSYQHFIPSPIPQKGEIFQDCAIASCLFRSKKMGPHPPPPPSPLLSPAPDHYPPFSPNRNILLKSGLRHQQRVSRSGVSASSSFPLIAFGG